MVITTRNISYPRLTDSENDDYNGRRWRWQLTMAMTTSVVTTMMIWQGKPETPKSAPSKIRLCGRSHTTFTFTWRWSDEDGKVKVMLLTFDCRCIIRKRPYLQLIQSTWKPHEMLMRYIWADDRWPEIFRRDRSEFHCPLKLITTVKLQYANYSKLCYFC